MENKVDEIKISRVDLIRLVKFVEEANHLFHQPLYFQDAEIVNKFAKTNYPEIHHLYYTVLTDVIPKDLKKELWDY
jgi:hypothetical protein